MRIRPSFVLAAALSLVSAAAFSESPANSTAAGAKNHPAVAMRPDGTGFVVVWAADGADGDGFGIVGRLFDGNGVPQGPGEFVINTTDTEITGDQGAPVVAMDGAGNFVVAWQCSGPAVYMRRFLADGTPVPGSEVLVNMLSGSAVNPAVAMDSAGNFAVAWETDTTGTLQVFGRWFDAAGNATSGPNEVQLSSTGVNGLPALAMTTEGTGVAWASLSGGQKDVKLRSYDSSGNPLTVEILVNTTTLGDQSFPAIAIGGTGTTVVAWQGPGAGSGQDIFAQRFGSNGQKREGEIVVNNVTAGDQMQPSVSLDAHGDFAVAWRDDNALDGAGQGVFYRTFRADGTAVTIQALGSVTTALNQYEPWVGMSMTQTPKFAIAYGSDGSGADDNILASLFDFGPTTTVLFPSLATENWAETTTHPVQFGFTLAPPGTLPTFDVTADRDGNFSGGACSTETIATGVTVDAGSTTKLVNWTLPAAPGGCGAGPWPNAKVRVVGTHGQQDDSIAYTITGAPSLMVMRPLMGSVPSGSPTEIRWNHNMGLPNVRIELSRDGGATYLGPDLISSSAPSRFTNRGTFQWTPAGVCDPSLRCKVKVCWLDNLTVCDESDIFNIAACPAITVTPSTLPQATVSTAYGPVNFVESVGAGNDPDTWSISAGTLPAGLNLTTAGVLSGTPTTPAQSTFVVRILDNNLCAGQRTFNVRTCNAITVNPAGPALAAGVVGTAHPGVNFSATPVTTYSFSVTVGALPGGLSLNATTGALTGTPTTSGNFSFTITATDGLGCTGSRAYTLNVTARPVIGNVGTVVAYTENQVATAIEPGLTLTDADSANIASATVQITANYQNDANGNDVLACPGCGLITPSFDVPSGTLTLSGSRPVAEYQSALQSVTYVHNTDNPTNSPRTVTWIASDGTNSSAAVTSTVNVTPVNDAPVLTAGATLNYTEGNAASVIDGTITVTDVDHANIASASAQITASYAMGDDVLACGSCGGLTVNFTAATGTLSISGSATKAVYQTALRSVTYFNGSQNPTTAARTVTWQVNDGAAASNLSNTPTSTINVAAVNDPPVAQNKNGGNVQANMKRTGIDASLLTGITDADSGVNGCSPTFSVASITTGSNGMVTSVNLVAGTFDFEPAAGFTGVATVNYAVSDNGCPGSATSAPAMIGLTVNGPVTWFVDDSAAGGGDGRLGREFQTVGAATTAIGASTNHKIFVYSGTYAQGASLNQDGWLIGQGVSTAGFDSIMGITPPAGTIARPQTKVDNGALARPMLQSTVTMGTNSNVKGLDISVSAAFTKGLVASGKTGLVTSEAGVTTATGTAVDLQSSGGTVSLSNVSANGGSNGIFLSNTTGSFTVTSTGSGTCTSGDQTGCTGGVIQNMTSGADATTNGIGIYLNNAQNVSLTRVHLHDFSNFAMRGFAVSGFTLSSSVVNGANGTSASENEGSVSFGASTGEPGGPANGLTGSALVQNAYLSGGLEDNLRVKNQSGSLNRLTLDGVTIGPNNAVSGNDGLLIEAAGAATVNVTVQNSFFTSAAGDLFQLNLLGTSVSDLVFTGNTLSNNHPLIATGGGGVTIVSGNNVTTGATLTFNISGNSFRDAKGHGVLLVKSTDPGSVTGTFSNNTIGVAGITDSGSLEGSGLKVQNAGLGTMTLAITGNQVRQYNNFGIELLTGGGASALSGALNATITGNTVSNPGTNQAVAIPKNGIHANIGTVPGDTYQACLGIGGGGGLANSITGSGSLGGTDFRLRQRQATTIRLPGYGGLNTDTAAVVAFVQGNNGGTPTGLASHTVPTGGGFVGGAACPIP